MLVFAILLLSMGLVYALSWCAAWVIARCLPVPEQYRSVLPWFLFQLHLVVGLFLVGDLPGAPQVTFRLAALAGGFSLIFGLLAHLWRQDQESWVATVGRWLGAGLLPWVVAMLAELIAWSPFPR